MEKSKIIIEGKGEISIVPDLICLNVEIRQRFDDYLQAYEEAKENSTKLAEILEKNGLSKDLAKTIDFDIEDHNEREYDRNGNYIGQTKNGLKLIQSFELEFFLDDKLVESIIEGIGEYIPNAQVDIDYGLQDEQLRKNEVLALAVRDARDTAIALADASGCRLGKVLNIYYADNFHVSSYHRPCLKLGSPEFKPTSNSFHVAPKDISVSGSVKMIWELVNDK